MQVEKIEKSFVFFIWLPSKSKVKKSQHTRLRRRKNVLNTRRYDKFHQFEQVHVIVLENL